MEIKYFNEERREEGRYISGITKSESDILLQLGDSAKANLKDHELEEFYEYLYVLVGEGKGIDDIDEILSCFICNCANAPKSKAEIFVTDDGHIVGAKGEGLTYFERSKKNHQAGDVQS